MSSLLLGKEHETDFIDNFTHKSFNFSQVILPYSTRSEKYIYTGIEKIPFNQRHSKFQLILKKEFSSAIKEYNKT